MHNQAAVCERISRGSRILFATRDVRPSSSDSDASEQNYRGRFFFINLANLVYHGGGNRGGGDS
jgi:hypothetical protein